ncbi:uncharacterized protein LOC129575665 [Sitodiplosis mosellana]|uniref:uncharacterized protein LOC129575665 n=1 Tax=Sitodiplosis mosellana TaxID=263140 RepID=UPI0024444145|nr:uncharacterized protein LOC129575665 [Sitodiplosis mosellana]XP_055315528.1 uncharacterized protein LOC129575665 [Sitodiplosis mosellana]XP_055315529.1 uncharacterized protein LOC129575665 [Sitodiplosis mosellana]XP_055315530.1 uncharacterized protein LOC129575665 [Sitodiplosis mosellana]XP_055315531.1 uncharacterized protein LOC129575665 [Sitodiplosis mosellana]XP_055315532.1 uncharacterized protein LOC129575665 [Sitodiplosis mosellana]XP_055315534.1 uncharacterized protein LOC129575665 [
MRPGPGLVVMALAFISGARRSTSQQSNPTIERNSNLPKEEQTGFLAQLNPWLSACDVANPITAPDLQGQCSVSGSTLPKHWVNEGPGPPICAQSCSEKYKTNFASKTTDSNLNMDEKNRFYEKQQCLDYLGDDKLTSSPEQICKKSSREISNKLRTLRLRHCCERNVYSALHDDGMSAVTKGGRECEQILQNLIEADALASRITCGLNEILFRYDCRQVYSIKHGCNDCKEAYRRWVCSTLIPYFAEPIDIRQSRNKENKENTNNNNNNNNINYNNNVNNNNEPNSKSLRSSLTDEEDKKTQVGLVSDDPVVFKILNRSKRKSTSEKRRKRIRPCLKICQSVEERCPYLLPGDRSPGYNTQYAGEPTFLCNDPNIPETGEQLAKSNNGADNCCYEYCNSFSVYMGACAYCDSVEPDPADSQTDVQLIQKKPVDETKMLQQRYDSSSVAKLDTPPQTCQLLPGLSLTSTRCEIPYYASSFDMTTLHSTDTSTPSTVSTSTMAEST